MCYFLWVCQYIVNRKGLFIIKIQVGKNCNFLYIVPVEYFFIRYWSNNFKLCVCYVSIFLIYFKGLINLFDLNIDISAPVFPNIVNGFGVVFILFMIFYYIVFSRPMLVIIWTILVIQFFKHACPRTSLMRLVFA